MILSPNKNHAEQVGCVIPLTQGFNAIVDADQYASLSKHDWFKHPNGAARSVNGRAVFMHRHILTPPTGFLVDHINRNNLDNRKCNLRVCTAAQNNRNAKRRIDNKSGYRGVSWHKATRSWVAQISVGGKILYLGKFDNPVDAAIAYDNSCVRLHGDFASLNFPKDKEGQNREVWEVTVDQVNGLDKKPSGNSAPAPAANDDSYDPFE
jgi:hypothetical protein